MSSGVPPAPRKRSILLLAMLGFLFVMVPYLFWRDTWFGRPLTSQEIGQYLQDSEHPRKIQQALSQIADRILRGDATVQPWYPQIAALAHHPNPILRTTAAWVMGQDNGSQPFHAALLDLLNDPELMVRRNAALALVRFQDASGRAELLKMLRSTSMVAPVEGIASIQTQSGQEIGAGVILLRIRAADGKDTEIRSPFAGKVDRVLPHDSARISAGDEVVSVSPGEDQESEALRGLSLVGQPEDLPEIERCEAGLSDRIRQQAVLTAQAIRTRAEPNPSR